MSNDYPLIIHGFIAVVQLSINTRSSRARIIVPVGINRIKGVLFYKVVAEVELDKVNTEVKLKVFKFPVITKVKKVAIERY